MRRKLKENGTSGAAHHIAGNCEYCDKPITTDALGDPQYSCVHEPKRLVALARYLERQGKPVVIRVGQLACKKCQVPLVHDGEGFRYTCEHDAPQFVEPVTAPTDDFPLMLAGEIAKPLPPVQWVLQHFQIAPGRPTLLVGYGGVGKTVIAQTIALAIASPKAKWCGLHVAHGHVVHIDYEMGEDAQRRYQRLAWKEVDLEALGERLALVTMPRIYLVDAIAEDRLTAVARGRRLIIIDSLLAGARGAKENDAVMRMYLDMLTRISLVTGCAFLVLHHEGKAPEGAKRTRSKLQRSRGHSGITDACGSVISVSSNGDAVLELEHTKYSRGKKSETIFVKIHDAGTQHFVTNEYPGLRLERTEAPKASAENVTDEGVEKTKAKIANVLREKQVGTNELVRAVGGRRQTTLQALGEMRDDGLVRSMKRDGGGNLLQLTAKSTEATEEAHADDAS